MNDHPDAPNPVTPPEDDWFANYARQERLRADLWPTNKASIMAALAAANITQIIISFDGYGDSGQIESVEGKAGDTVVDLPSHTIAWLTVGASEPRTEQIDLNAAVENLAYDCLAQTHMGWENNEGAYGEIIFDVAEHTITLDYNERIETSEYYQHVL